MEYNYFLINPEKDKLLQLIKSQISELILPSANKLNEILENEDFPVLKINMLIRKIEKASTEIGIELRAQVNIAIHAKEKQAYQRHIYKQLKELYEKYGTENNGIDWEKIKEEKGVKFLKSFPLKDAIEAAKMVQSGELEI